MILKSCSAPTVAITASIESRHLDLAYLESLDDVMLKLRGGGGNEDYSPPQLCRNPSHSGNFSQRTIGYSDNFSDCFLDLFDLSSRKCAAL